MCSSPSGRSAPGDSTCGLAAKKRAAFIRRSKWRGWGAVRDHIAANAEVGSRDFMEIPAFTGRGGIVKARALFGERLPTLLDELTNALVA